MKITFSTPSSNVTLFIDLILGTRFSIKYKNVIDSLGNIIYYSVTTLSGFQTLGEEYTGIIQTDNSLRQMPSTSVSGCYTYKNSKRYFINVY